MELNQLIQKKIRNHHWEEYPLYLGQRLINLIINKAEECSNETPFKPEGNYLILDSDELTIYLEYTNLNADINYVCSKLQGRKVTIQGSIWLNHPAVKPAIYANKFKLWKE